MEFFFYVISNPDWTNNGNKYKYGIVEIKKGRDEKQSLCNRIYSYHTYSSYIHKYTTIYKLTLGKPYNFYEKPDDIISIFGRQLDKTKSYKLNDMGYIIFTYDNFPYLYDIHNYLVNNDGGTEYIYDAGLDCLDSIIMDEFPKLYIYSEQMSDEFVDEVNELNKEKLKLKNKNKNSESDSKFTIIENINNNNKLTLHIKPKGIHQVTLYNNLNDFIQKKIGQLIWCCGLGKTFMSLMICYKLNVKSILICVPSVYL